jgi:NADH-ubiquinone oxidoreductase chain 6
VYLTTLGLIWQCTHPFLVCLLLILLSATAGGVLALCLNKWVCYALILIFLGGIIVVFIYITSLASNEKFFLNKVKPLLLVLVICRVGGLHKLFKPLLFTTQPPLAYAAPSIQVM